MTQGGESQKHLEAPLPKIILSTGVTTTIGTWNVRTMFEAGKNTISNKELWERTSQKPADEEILQRLCSTYENVREYNSLAGENVLLAERYTELLIVETHRKQREKEEEIRCRGEDHQKVLKTRASEAYKRITVDQLFKPDDRRKVPKAVILQGHSGYGKSFTAQKIMYDWASEKVFKDLFDLVLHLKCKELNEISEACSLVDLLRVTNETAEVLRDSKMNVLFLIDGFDELKSSFEKTSTVPPKDPFREAPVEAILGALLKGLLLPKCFLLVTTRSTASDKLSDLLSDSQRFTDILGFTEEGVNEYFQRFFKEELLAKKAVDCVRTNETLYTACFIPVICWITCTVFREQEQEGTDITKELETTTSIFVHFVSTLLKHHCQGLSQPETLLRSLGQLAERGLQEHKVLFDEMSLSEAFPDPSQATKYNPFLCKFLLKSPVEQERMYSFMHLSFQEFFAACQYLMLENEEEALDKLRELLGNVEHFKAVVQFLFGLSNRGIYPHLKKQSWASIQAYLQEWLLSVLKKHSMHQDGMLHILHCLYELHEEEFVREAMGVWGEMEFDRIPLTRTDCWVLLYCLQCCLTIKSLKLTNCNITAEKLRMLQPALIRCKELG
ncbi:NACHT, LRR and PYD domains-containing protein 1 homolog [Clupea harengus]|uniref:NACHT, LRR and PYD domains-containing protein 1 homolog n=1 Tax=Clupea harengus TaxID=7950 RepID=A0A8M1KBH2_CLUHA|nr:NACHT, LRR and PYD domains-containing protein 1 homolog [Clupea harengus]